MFELDVNDSYHYPVTVPVPTEQGVKEFQFEARFKRLPQSEIDAISERAARMEISDQELAERVLVGWRGVRENGEELAFSPEARNRLLDVNPVRECVLAAWFESISARGRAKN